MRNGNKSVLISIVTFLLAMTLIVPINAMDDFTTEDTFEGLGGQYSIDYILNAYNVFSFDTASGSHIVGPIVAQGDLKNLDGGNITYSNVHYGVSSFIKGTSHHGLIGDLNSGTEVPSQYFGSVNSIVNDGSNYNVNGMYFVPTNKVVGVKNTDDYVDWNKAYNELSSQSEMMYHSADRMLTKDDIKIINGRKVIQVFEGESVVVSSNVVSDISMIIYITNDIHNSTNTIVNFESEGSINVPKIGHSNNEHTLGNDFPTDESNSLGHSFILNAPFAKELNFKTDTSPWFGHVVAVNATVNVANGNYNGSMIVGNMLSKAEGHKWSYNGASTKPTTLQFTKMIDGNRSFDETFEFILEQVSTPTTNIPIKKTILNNRNDLDVNFGLFKEAGSYYFKFYENVNVNNENFLMDQSVYHITFEVVKSANNKMTIENTIIKKVLNDVETEISSFDNLIFNNQRNVEKVNLSLQKKWIGKAEDFITVDLLANNEVIDTYRIDESMNWKLTIKDLPKYDDNEKEIQYVFKEHELDNYETVYEGSIEDGFIIINTEKVRKPELINVSVSKKWIGKSLDFVTVDLLANNEVIDTYRIDESMNWKLTIEDLPKYDDNEKKIQYVFKEHELDNYVIQYEGNLEDGFIIVNKERPVKPIEPVNPTKPINPIKPITPVKPGVPKTGVAQVNRFVLVSLISLSLIILFKNKD